MVDEDAQRDREGDEMAKTHHENARHLDTKGEQSQPRPPSLQSALLIMSQIYRKWATMRLKHQETWNHKWTLPQKYAGVQGQGAEQAWWQLSLCLEYWRAKQTQATTDIYKCFDQVVRPLIYMTARIAGMPARILKPYIGAIENLQIRNTLTVGYGQEHTRKRGIPQGCPFSMTLTALLVRLWILQVLRALAIPRVLADDLHVVAAGEKTSRENLRTIKNTHTFDTTAGGRIAASKSYAYSRDKRTRKRLANTEIRDVGSTPEHQLPQFVATSEDRST